MDENIIKLIVVVIQLIMALIPLIKEIAQIRNSDEIKQKIKKIIYWLFCIVITLILPSAAIIMILMSVVSFYLASIIIDINVFVVNLVFIISSLAVLYPICWGVYIYPKLRQKLNNNNYD